MKIEVNKPADSRDLFEEIRESKLESQIVEIDVDIISSGKHQPREVFNNDKLMALANSIKENELLQPIVVEKLSDVEYKIIAGERRWRAVKLLGLKTIKCIIKNRVDKDKAMLALIENVQREDLNPMEEAKAYDALIKNFDLTHQQVSERVGKGRSTISNMLRLLDLCRPVKQAISDCRIEMGHARALVTLSNDLQKSTLNQILTKDLTVRATENFVRNLINKNDVQVESDENGELRRYYSKELKKRFFNSFPVDVKFSKSKKGSGKLIIDFITTDELELLLNVIEKDSQ